MNPWFAQQQAFANLNAMLGGQMPGFVGNQRVAQLQAENAKLKEDLARALPLAAFCVMLGEENLSKAYRSASVKAHPDNGGDTEKMSHLNAAWEFVRGFLRKQGPA